MPRLEQLKENTVLAIEMTEEMFVQFCLEEDSLSKIYTTIYRHEQLADSFKLIM